MSPPSQASRFWLQNPVDTRFRVTSRFNDPRDYTTPGKKKLHEGIDLHALDANRRPVAVLAAQRGMVDKVGNYPPGYGLYVRIRHDWPDGQTYVTWYGHMSKITAKEGQFVQAGQKLGIAGDTGFSFGIHLHLTLQHLGHGLKNYVVDDVVDPEPFFQPGGVATKVNECMFVADETVPDGTILQPGQTFPKTWRVRNSGTTTWGTGYTLAFFDGDQMGGPESIPLPGAKPGQEVSITVPLTAPNRPGRHRSVWKPRDGQGNFFEFDVYADIVVAGSADRDDAEFLADVTVPDGTKLLPGQTFLKKWRVRNTGTTAWRSGYRLVRSEGAPFGAPAGIPLPAARPDEEVDVTLSLTAPPTPGIHRGSWRFQNPGGEPFGDFLFTVVEVPREETTAGESELSYVDDVTVADGTRVQPGQVLEKIWRVRNTGTTTWGPGYDLVFFSDEQMGGPESLPLPAAAPGQTVDIQLALTAPEAAGTHRSTWKPRTPEGEIFDHDLYMEIEVVQSIPDGEMQLDDARFLRDITIPDGSLLTAGTPFVKTWRMRNTGTTTWGPGYDLVFVEDEPMGTVTRVPLPVAAPGEEVDISVRLQAPLLPGSHKSTWRPHNPQGQPFGHWFYAVIRVPAPIPAGGRLNRAKFVTHGRTPPGTVVAPGETFVKQWLVRNIGENRWGNGYTLSHFRGERLDGPDSTTISKVEPNRSIQLEVTLKAPTQPGRYRGFWKLRDSQGKRFGPRLLVSIRVKE